MFASYNWGCVSIKHGNSAPHTKKDSTEGDEWMCYEAVINFCIAYLDIECDHCIQVVYLFCRFSLFEISSWRPLTGNRRWTVLRVFCVLNAHGILFTSVFYFSSRSQNFVYNVFKMRGKNDAFFAHSVHSHSQKETTCNACVTASLFMRWFFGIELDRVNVYAETFHRSYKSATDEYFRKRNVQCFANSILMCFN